ncbi:MAG TPA: hypothetical protein VFO55_14400 [Gemmatimonadaceae bacterium]|nr:hypothetical protein [Gemmatimonadaceae bacterium]
MFLTPLRAVLLLGLAAASGCASSATPTPRPQTVYIPGSGALTLSTHDGAVTTIIGAPIDAVWRLLPTAFDSVGVPLTLIDPRRHTIGNEGFKVRQKLGTTRLSSYFECGTTQVGPNADSYELYVTVMTSLEPEGTTRTKLTTTVTGAAKPMQFAQDYSRCSSKSALETRIADVVAAAVKR